MRKLFAALACAGALCAAAAAPFGWIALTAPAPFVRSVESALPRVDVAAVDLTFAPTPARGFLEAEYPAPGAVHELLPLPPRRPAATKLLLDEAQASVDRTARQLGVRLDLWCMAAINKWLGRIGVKGTGSDLAVSVRRWGVASKPVPGAIALKPRKGGSGHVVIVKAVRGKTLIAISPNHRGKVREARYPLRVFTAFRAPAA